MANGAEPVFRHLLVELEADTIVLAAFLIGSRGKGFGSPDSDYDVVIICGDASGDEVRCRYPFRYHPHIDCIVHTLSEFRVYAAPGSASSWDRYSFSQVDVLFDRSGEVQTLIDEKGSLEPGERGPLLREELDSYINSVYRSMKRSARRDRLGARLEAAQSISHLLAVLFGLEGRLAPFPGYLKWELEKYPLARLPISPEELLARIDSILAGGGVSVQQGLLGLLEAPCRAEGLDDVIEGWGEDYGWMLSYAGGGLHSPVPHLDTENPGQVRYALAAFPSLPLWVEELRQRFDPLANLVPAHITLVHPFPSRLGSAELRAHVEESLEGVESFQVTLRGITGHESEYLFLNVTRGNDRIIDLRSRLYRGRLARNLNRTKTFVPHVTLGRLDQTDQLHGALEQLGSYDQAIETVVGEVIGYRIHVDGRRENVVEVRLDKPSK